MSIALIGYIHCVCHDDCVLIVLFKFQCKKISVWISEDSLYTSMKIYRNAL